MKPQEVIDILKMFTTDKFQRCTSSEFDDAIYVAIEALEKQESKTIYEHIDTRLIYKVRYDKYRCSECGFTTKFTDGHIAQYKYCPQCGQRISWEVTE